MDEGSLATGEYSVNSEIMESLSLSGRELSADWPKLATWTEHDKARGLAQGIDAVKQLSYELKNGDRSLLYLAVSHTNNPDDPELDLIEQQFRDFNPEVVLYEGPHNPLWESREQMLLELENQVLSGSWLKIITSI